MPKPVAPSLARGDVAQLDLLEPEPPPELEPEAPELEPELDPELEPDPEPELPPDEEPLPASAVMQRLHA
jgi:hypothetical protein